MANNEYIFAEYGTGTTKIKYKIFNGKAYVTVQDKDITEARIHNEIWYYDEKYPVVYIENCAFKDCKKLHTVTIPPNVYEIGNGVFSGCTSLKNITIPKTVTKMGSEVFIKVFIDNIRMPETVDNTYRLKWGGTFTERAEKNLCIYCGGAFKGLLTKKCSVCGREKDYTKSAVENNSLK